jgi:lysine biosynthesis protein LysW
METTSGAPVAARMRPSGGLMAKCPECESDLELDGYELDVGESINCPECSIELKVTSNDPISVSLSPEE